MDGVSVQIKHLAENVGLLLRRIGDVGTSQQRTEELANKNSGTLVSVKAELDTVQETVRQEMRRIEDFAQKCADSMINALNGLSSAFFSCTPALTSFLASSAHRHLHGGGRRDPQVFLEVYQRRRRTEFDGHGGVRVDGGLRVRGFLYAL